VKHARSRHPEGGRRPPARPALRVRRNLCQQTSAVLDLALLLPSKGGVGSDPGHGCARLVPPSRGNDAHSSSVSGPFVRHMTSPLTVRIDQGKRWLAWWWAADYSHGGSQLTAFRGRAGAVSAPATALRHRPWSH
jgi:hypothetical protein